MQGQEIRRVLNSNSFPSDYNSSRLYEPIELKSLEILINSKIPLTKSHIRQLYNLQSSVKIKIEGPRVLWNDVKEILGVHITLLFFTGGLSLIAYLGFYLYEKWKPLYIVSIEHNTNNAINPLFEVKIDD